MNNKNDEKPWEKTFEEDRDEQGNYSRTANRRNAKNNTMLTTSLLIIFILFFFYFTFNQELK